MNETKRSGRKVFLFVWLGLIAALLAAIFLLGLPPGEEESIKAEIADNWLGLQNALETLSASRANVGLARESLDFAESGYREGVNTQLDVLQARSDLTSALQQLALALKNARTAQAALWKSEGVFLENAFRHSRLNAEFIPIGTKKTK